MYARGRGEEDLLEHAGERARRVCAAREAEEADLVALGVCGRRCSMSIS